MGQLYTMLKIFHFKDKLDTLPREVSAVAPPLHIRIKPTNACNHSCTYCAYRVDHLQLGQDMSVKDSIPRGKMAELVEDLGEMGVQAVTFSGGGEPFCYPHLTEAARGLVQQGIRIASLTNGSLLKGEAAELFALHGTWVRISMDGWDDASYARYRSAGPGEYSKIMANIESFKKVGGPCRLGVSLIVDEHNHPHVYEAISRLPAVGVDSVKVSPCIVSNKGAENNRYHAPFFAAVKEQVGRAIDEHTGGDFEIYDTYHKIDEKFHKDYTWCPYQQVLPVIGADCNVYTCQDKAYNLDTGCLGSIADQRFRDFWLESKERFFQVNPSRDCNHHCVSNAKNKLIFEYLGADPEHLGFV